jgi:hypothetical protein
MAVLDELQHQARRHGETAISDRSMPRPITTIAMARPRMPSTATFCSRVSMFDVVRKPGRRIAKHAEQHDEYREDDSLLRESTRLSFTAWNTFSPDSR